jgi:O2-independent ubiquinone biosynthesis accessory factor UbiT
MALPFALPRLSLPKLPAFTLPPVVAEVVGRLPMTPPAFALTQALDFGVGRVVSAESVAALEGRRFALRVTDLGLRLRFESRNGRFHPLPDDAPCDLSVSATLRDFIALTLREEDPDTLFFARRLIVEGDTDLGLTVKNLLDAIDWEALLPAPLRRR